MQEGQDTTDRALPLLVSYLPLPSADLHRFDFDVDLDVVADGQSAALEQHVPGQAEIAAIDLALRAEARSLATPRILRLPLELDVEGDLSRYVADRQVAGELELVPVSLDTRALEPDIGVLLDVEEIPRTEVLVALISPRVEARRLQRCLHRRL